MVRKRSPRSPNQGIQDLTSVNANIDTLWIYEFIDGAWSSLTLLGHIGTLLFADKRLVHCTYVGFTPTNPPPDRLILTKLSFRTLLEQTSRCAPRRTQLLPTTRWHWTSTLRSADGNIWIHMGTWKLEIPLGFIDFQGFSWCHPIPFKFKQASHGWKTTTKTNSQQSASPQVLP